MLPQLPDPAVYDWPLIYMVYRTLRKYIVPNYGWMDEFSPELKNCPISDHILKNQNNLTKNEDIF